MAEEPQPLLYFPILVLNQSKPYFFSVQDDDKLYQVESFERYGNKTIKYAVFQQLK